MGKGRPVPGAHTEVSFLVWDVCGGWAVSVCSFFDRRQLGRCSKNIRIARDRTFNPRRGEMDILHLERVRSSNRAQVEVLIFRTQQFDKPFESTDFLCDMSTCESALQTINLCAVYLLRPLQHVFGNN